MMTLNKNNQDAGSHQRHVDEDVSPFEITDRDDSNFVSKCNTKRNQTVTTMNGNIFETIKIAFQNKRFWNA